MDPDKTIEIYERLREKAEKNVRATGLDTLSFELSEWRIVDNPANRCKDVIISVCVNARRREFTIRFDELAHGMPYISHEGEAIKAGRQIAARLREKIADHIAEHMAEDVFRGCAHQLVRMK